jgi:bifunctional DNA-binding transcriptional regulator/antitoxin component of YhaV-PrlF toxin-antitoxin module
MSRSSRVGEWVLPGELRKALGVSVGDSVVIEIKDGELRLRSLDAAIKRAQETVRRYVPEGVSLADERSFVLDVSAVLALPEPDVASTAVAIEMIR